MFSILLFLFSSNIDFNKCQKQLTHWAFKENDVDACKALSLYYRIMQNYHAEYKIVQKCIEYAPYFKERMEWHKKPMSEKIQPRHTNVFFDERLPKPETLKNLCIVTGSDSNYFPMLIETVQSIKATKRYKDIPLIVIDGGLEENQKKYLIGQFGCIIKNSQWPIPVSNKTPNYMKCVIFRPFLPEIIPEYRYYLWIDSDAWVYSEHAFDRHVCLAEDQGFAVCAENKRLYHFTLHTCIGWKDWLSIMFKKQLNVGVFCIDSQSDFQKEWSDYARKVFTQNGKNFFEKDGISKMPEQHTATVIFYKKNMVFLNKKENYCLRLFGIPVVSSKDDILRDPQTLDPVGVVHLVHNKTARTKDNPVYYVPTQICDKPMSWFRLFIHKYFTKILHYFRPEQVEFLSSGKRFISWRFPIIQEDKNLEEQFQSLYLNISIKYKN